MLGQPTDHRCDRRVVDVTPSGVLGGLDEVQLVAMEPIAPRERDENGHEQACRYEGLPAERLDEARLLPGHRASLSWQAVRLVRPHSRARRQLVSGAVRTWSLPDIQGVVSVTQAKPSSSESESQRRRMHALFVAHADEVYAYALRRSSP